MVEARLPYRGLMLLGRAFREQSSGALSLGRASTALRLILQGGHIVAVVFPEEKPPVPALSGPDDSAQLRLERVLTEIGIRATTPKTSPRAQRNLRERMLAGLLDTDAAASFAPGASPADAVEVAGATEPLILEAIRRVPDPQAVREGLGDLEQRLVATVGLAEERTLTLTEGYILSRVDGVSSAREVLQLVPLEPEETERTLLGLLLTGRLEYRPAPAVAPAAAQATLATAPPSAAGPGLGEGAAASAPTAAPRLETPAVAPEERVAREDTAPAAEPEPAATPSPAEAEAEPPAAAADPPPAEPDAPPADAPPADAPPADAPPADAVPAEDLPIAAAVARETHEASGESAPTEVSAPARPEIDHVALERRRELLEYFQALPTKNHFEVLGVQPGCTDTEVKRAYAALVRKYHPDALRRGSLEDLQDVLHAIFIRVGEAWEVLGDARSRTSYEARFPPGMRRSPTAAGAVPAGGGGVPIGPPPAAEESDPEAPYVASEETLSHAQLLLTQARYWDAIQMLEQRLPQMPPSKQQRRGRILLARAYAKNPNWLRKAEDALQQVVREEPGNAEAHYELGLLYKSGGMMARAHASFRRALEVRPDHREAAAELGIVAQPSGARPAGGLLKRLFGGGKAS